MLRCVGRDGAGDPSDERFGSGGRRGFGGAGYMASTEDLGDSEEAARGAGKLSNGPIYSFP